MGITTFVELGPGTVLTGMAKRIVPAPAPCGRHPDELDRLLETLARPRRAVGVHEGEHLFATERVVVSPSAASSTAPRAIGADDLGPATCSAGRRRGGPLPLRRHVMGMLTSRASGSPRSRSPGCESADGPVVASRAGARPCPEKIVTNADFEARLDTMRRLDRRAHRHPGAPRRAGPPSACRPRPASRPGASAGVDAAPTSTCCSLATTTPDQPIPGSSASVQNAARHRAAAPSTSTPPAPASSTPSSSPPGWSPSGIDRVLLIGTDCMSPHRRPRRPGHRHPLRRRRRRGRHRGGRRPGRAARLGPRLRRLAAPPPRRRPRRLHPDGRQGGLPPGGAGRWSTPPARRSTRAGLDAGDVALFVPHQANTRIIDVGLRAARASRPTGAAIVLERTGNTSAGSSRSPSSTPLDNGRIHDGDLVLLCGFGAGMTWASAVLRWGA